jgi:hypothetical protein
MVPLAFAAELLRGGKRPFIKRTCRSKSRCGGADARVYPLYPLKFLNDDLDGLLGGRRSRGVGRSRRSRRGGCGCRGGYEYPQVLLRGEYFN